MIVGYPGPPGRGRTTSTIGDISPEQLHAAQAPMTQAREADCAGDQSACEQALTMVRRVFDF